MNSTIRWIYAGDGIHLTAGLLLAGWILSTQTCRGISGRTQTIICFANLAKFAYAIGEATYLPYEICMSSVMALESLIVMSLIFIKFKKTVEKAYDTFWIEVIIIISMVLAVVNNEDASDPFDVLYAGSYYLESVSILPQMYFNFRTGSKNLGISLYVLVCTVYKSFHVYYAVTTDRYYAPVSLYPGYIQLGTYVLYFTLLVAIPKYKEEKLIIDLDSYSVSLDDLTLDGDNQPPVIILTRPALERQQSRLEMPFLKKTLPSSASLTTFTANSNHSSKINTPAIQKKVFKLKNVSSSPNFKTKNSKVTIKRTHSASSIVSLGQESLPDSLDEGITFKIKETAREGRQRRMAYVRQISLPERKSSQFQADEELKRKEPKREELNREELKRQERNENPEEKAIEQINGNDWLVGDETQSKPDDARIPNVHEVIEDQKKHHVTLQVSGGIQANDLDSTRKVSEPNSRRPSCPDAALEKKRRKRTISTSPDFHRKGRRSTMQAGMYSQQQHNWKVLASTFIGMNPPISLLSSPVHQDIVDWPDSCGEHDAVTPHFRDKKKRRATVQALNMQHHSNWKTLATGLIGTNPTPQSPMSARFPEASPEMSRIACVQRSNSDSKCANNVKNQRRATVQMSPAMPAVKKRCSWQKLTNGFNWTSPAAQRRVSSPINHFGDQSHKSKEGKTKVGKQRNSRDQSGDVIEEGAEGQD